MNDQQPGKDASTYHPQMVCPRWMCFSFDNAIRRMLQNPQRILQPYVKPGYTILDVGPGVGNFTIPLARLTGENGKVIAADLQPAMLATIHQRALKAGVDQRIIRHQTGTDSLGVNEPVDFCLAFWMVHEVPDRARLLGEIAADLKPGGLFLFVEPRLHVHRDSFETSLKLAVAAGLKTVSRPKIFLSYAALLQK
jgi:ubiquinone/menaquinone biosynthesis C-methylase UbiE